MVTVIDFAERKSADGTEFFALVVDGGIEMIQSGSGGHYATSRTASIPSTFDAASCQRLIGTELDGEVRKVEVEPYEFTIPETGEQITLTHSYVYVSE